MRSPHDGRTSIFAPLASSRPLRTVVPRTSLNKRQKCYLFKQIFKWENPSRTTESAVRDAVCGLWRGCSMAHALLAASAALRHSGRPSLRSWCPDHFVHRASARHVFHLACSRCYAVAQSSCEQCPRHTLAHTVPRCPRPRPHTHAHSLHTFSCRGTTNIS